MHAVHLPFLSVFLQDIHAVLYASPEGRAIVENLDRDKLIAIKERRAMVWILVSHLMERCGET